MKRLSISLIALLAAAPALAQSTDTELDEIVVTANRSETPVSRAGAVVTRVDEEEITAQPGQSAVQLLSQLPGVAFRTNGPLGTQAGLTVRGVPQTNIGVRVDGIDVTDPSGTQVSFDFGTLTTLDLSAVELVRGAQSAQYGSRTVGGAFEFTTRRPTEDGLMQDVLAEVGSYGTKKLSYGLSLRDGANELGLTLSHVESDGFSAADEDDGNSEADGYRADRLSFFAATEAGDGVRLSFNGFVESSLADYDEEASGEVFDGTPDDTINRDAYGLRAAAEFSTGAFDHLVEISRFRIDRVLSGTAEDYRGVYVPFEYGYRGERHMFAYRGQTDLGATTSLLFGAEAIREVYFDDISIGDDFTSSQALETGIDAVYGELTYAPTDILDIVMTARQDEHSRFGGFTTGRLSVNWRPVDGTTVRFNLGNGFRAPSNYELFDAYYGVDTLQPETSVSRDVGVEQEISDAAKVALTVFDVTTRDLIDFDMDDYEYVQRPGQVQRRGVELAMEAELAAGLTVTGAYTYTESQTDTVLEASAWSANAPRHSLALGLGADLGAAARIEASALFVAGRADLPDYAVVNSTLSYDLTDKAELYLRAENLFDENYQTVPGYGTSRRAFYAGVRASF